MAIRWLSSIVVHWAPILTFGRRRDEILEWIESNTEPVAFSDDEHALGLAFGFPDTRIMISRRRLLVSSGASGVPLHDVLDTPMQGILEILDPAQATISAMSFKVSANLERSDYDVLTKEFAARGAGVAGDIAGWRARDAAVLMDMSTEEYDGQVEYGIVRSSEISQRVGDPGIGRLGSAVDPPAPKILDRRIGEAAEVSLFVDAQVMPLDASYVASSEEIWTRYADAEARVLAVTDELARSF